MHKIVEYFRWKIAHGSKLMPCKDCVLAKAKQKNVPKQGTGEKATEPNGRWYHDQYQLKPPVRIEGMNTTWHATVNEWTKVEVLAFYAAKNKFIEPFCKHIQQQQAQGKPVKIIRMGNASTNKKLQERMMSADWKLVRKLEYTSGGASVPFDRGQDTSMH